VTRSEPITELGEILVGGRLCVITPPCRFLIIGQNGADTARFARGRGFGFSAPWGCGLSRAPLAANRSNLSPISASLREDGLI